MNPSFGEQASRDQTRWRAREVVTHNPKQDPMQVLAANLATQIGQLIQSGRLKDASRVLDAALQSGLEGPRLELMRRLLTIGVTPQPEPPASGVGRLRFEASTHGGYWVALENEMVVGSARTLAELRRQQLPVGAVLHWVPARDTHAP